MHHNVYDVFYDFNASIENVLPWMHLDIRGLVRIGVGNLIDSIPAALNLPFEYDKLPGVYAAPDEIRAEWQLVKFRTDLALRGANAFQTLTKLRLSNNAIRTLMSEKLLENEAYLKQLFPEFEQWPADAQLGLLSMAWALGGGFPKLWPHFCEACLRQDWNAAVEHYRIKEIGNPSVISRNNANQDMFSYAAHVAEFEKQYGYRRDIVYYPIVNQRAPNIVPERALFSPIFDDRVQGNYLFHCRSYEVN